jgi:histidyl-tRNA synthetase
MPTISGPKGTRDFYPEDMALRERMFASWHKTCRRFGFELYDGPMFELLELYTQKSGDEIEKQLYTFQDKGGRLMALRPEITPTLARMVAAKGVNLKRPIRWYSIPRLFRYERMQKGRLREFFQLNMDILGIQGVQADAELIAAVIDMMRDLGFSSDDFTVRISSRTLLEGLFMSVGVAQENLGKLYLLLDKKHKITPEEFSAELSSVAVSDEQRARISGILDASSLSEVAGIDPDLPAIKELENLFSLLSAYGLKEYVAFDIGIVRGLAYYTGIVFEVFDKVRSLRAIAGGGRYDKLVAMYGGPDTPAVGFAAGDVVLGELYKSKFGEVAAAPRSDVFIVSFDQSRPEIAIESAGQLRRAGISCEFSLKACGVGKQMETANAAKCRIVAFVGGSESAEGKVKLKIMATGEEKTVAEDGLVEEIVLLLGFAHPR